MKNSKQKTIGINPLEDYITKAGDKDSQLTIGHPDHVKKQRVTFHISVDLIERLKNAVYWEPGLTLAALAEVALAKELDELEQERGGPYAQRKEHKLRVGRPII